MMRNARMLIVAVAVIAVIGIVVLYSFTARAEDKAPAVGSAAPDFTLNNQEGKAISLHDFKGKWVVLYFYPKDMTTGCTIEAHNFQRDQEQYTKENAVILGVSVDSTDSHKQFCTKENLTFRLLADPDKKVVKAYGSLGNFGVVEIA